MVKGDRSDSIELSKVILVRGIVSMPSDDIERGVVILQREELSLEFVYNSPLLLHIFVP